MNYRVIGSDGRQYGPVSRELLLQWVAEARVHRGTLVRVDASPDWQALDTVPGFFGSQPTVPPATYWNGPASLGPRRTNPWAIWGLVCGLVSLTFCSCCCLPLELLGVVFSIVALVQISSHPETESGTALAIIGLVLSVLSFFLGFILSAVWFGAGGEEFFRELERQFCLGGAFNRLF